MLDLISSLLNRVHYKNAKSGSSLFNSLSTFSSLVGGEKTDRQWIFPVPQISVCSHSQILLVCSHLQ